MHKSIVLFFLLFCLSFISEAQRYRDGHLFGFSANVGSGEYAGTLSWSHYHGIGSQKRFQIGYGLRLSSYFGQNQDYVTAPAQYTAGKESFAALFSPERFTENYDTLRFASPQVNALNAAIFLSYTPPIFDNRLDIAMNIDVVGFSFAARQRGEFQGEGDFNGGPASSVPTAFNLLLISDSDLGSLHSEWYLRYWLRPQWALKLGFGFLFTEFTTSDKIQPIPNTNEFNDRFRRKSGLLMLGIQYAPFKS